MHIEMSYAVISREEQVKMLALNKWCGSSYSGLGYTFHHPTWRSAC